MTRSSHWLRKRDFPRQALRRFPRPGEPELAELETYFEHWIERGHAGDMEYLKRRDEDNRLLRSSLRIAVPWARSVIVCAANYNADAPRSIDPASAESAWIARYAWTGYRSNSLRPARPSDYHDVLLARLKKLEHSLQQSSVLSIPLLRRYRPAGGAGLRQIRRHRLDRQEHLHP